MKNWSIQELEDSYLEEKFRKDTIEPATYWRASSMGGCYRKRIYAHKGVAPTEVLQPRIRRVLDTGDIFHWKYQNFLKRIGILIGKEIEIKDEKYHYIGHFDALVGGVPKAVKSEFEYTNKITGEKKFNEKMYKWTLNKAKEIEKDFPEGLPLILYDFKTQHSQSFSYLLKDGPQKDHVTQLESYLVFIDKKKYPVSEGRLMYISKDDSRILEFVVKLDPETDKKIKKELTELQAVWESGKLPPKLEDLTLESYGRWKKKKNYINWKCRFCSYLTHCKGLNWHENATKEANKLNQNL